VEAVTEQRNHIGSLDPGTLALLKDVAEATAEKTVKSFATMVGIDHSNPIQAQRSFAALRKLADRMDDDEHQADQEWTRRTRMRTQGIAGKAVMTAVGVSVLGAAHALWNGIVTLAK